MENLTVFNCFVVSFLIGGFAIFILSIIKYFKKVIAKIEQNEINLKRKK